ncbi:hypothetical protein [Nocardioides sp.]|uniref:hypothetical protein n=1 Tax=Nocardioides sp. TaxID=35761 RepID=UPI0026386EAF|nr:hypothetical protein [Nocardioides sp.]
MSDFLKERWLAIVLAVIAIVFIVQNRDKTHINLLWINITCPLWLTMTVMTLIGMGIGFMLSRHRARAKA